MASPGAPSGYRTWDLEFLACDPLVSRGSGANTAFSSLVLELFASLLHVNSVHLSSASASWGPAACQARGDRNLRVLLREQGLPVNPAGGPRVRGGGGTALGPPAEAEESRGGPTARGSALETSKSSTDGYREDVKNNYPLKILDLLWIVHYIQWLNRTFIE